MGLNGTYRNSVVEEVILTSSVDWYGVPYTSSTINYYNILNPFSGYTTGGTFFSYVGISEIDLALMTDTEYDDRRNDLLLTIETLTIINKETLITQSEGTDLVLCPITPTTTTTSTTTTTTAVPTTTTTTTAVPTTTTTTTAVPEIIIYWSIQRSGSSGSSLKIFVNDNLMIKKSATNTLQSGSFIVNNGDVLLVRNSWISGSGNVSRCRVCNDFNGSEIDYTEADIDSPVLDTTYTIGGTSVAILSRGGGLTPPLCTV